MPAELRFRAMGTTALVAVYGDPTLAALAQRRIEELEGRWSRFRPDSEVNGLRTAAGSPCVVSADTIRLVSTALAAWQLTGGRFDPMVRDAMERNGYDRTFPEIDPAFVPHTPARPAAGCALVEVDPDRQTVTLPPTGAFDAGGIGKGLAADMIAEELLAAGATGVLVDLGGDIRVAGHGPHDGAWIVDVEAPFGGAALAHLALSDGAVATSSCLRRRWGPTRQMHHIVDPSTGLPARTAIAAATVFAAEAWQAEALATAVIVAGDPAVAGAAPCIAVQYDGAVLGRAA